MVRLIRDGDSLARQTGLIDSRGRPVRGLPASLVGGGLDVATALWRGAFLAHGSLTEPGRSMAMEITCPGSEAALALVAVSYTHLDVYKRQSWRTPALRPGWTASRRC